MNAIILLHSENFLDFTFTNDYFNMVRSGVDGYHLDFT